MQVQVKGEIEEIPAEQGPESLQTEKNDAEKDIDKNETVISQKNGEG